MDIIIRMIGVYIYQLQYFLIENDVNTQQWHDLDLFSIITKTEGNPFMILFHKLIVLILNWWVKYIDKFNLYFFSNNWVLTNR
jgi:hypothetical protein